MESITATSAVVLAVSGITSGSTTSPRLLRQTELLALVAGRKNLDFVNYDAGFALHNPEVADITSLSWKQLAWIQPESLIADSAAFLTFVSRNESIFVAVWNALKDLSDKFG